MLLLLLAVPSVTGVMADRRLRRSLDGFNRLVYQAHERSMGEHRSYLLVWADKEIELRPEVFLKGDDPAPTAQWGFAKNETLTLSLTAALSKDPPAEWIFWPSGACEPADVKFTGRDGSWTASYSPLTARAQIVAYAAH